MNPNSQNQRWSKWQFDIGIAGKDMRVIRIDELQTNFAKFLRKCFGSTAGRAKIVPRSGGVRINVLIEGSDITPTDPAYVAWVKNAATVFFTGRLGAGAQVSVDGKLMAGLPQNGKPADQMLVMPFLNWREMLMYN